MRVNPMPRALIGSRVRERRRALGITQGKLAAAIGISPSYLNLIEADKRNIGGALLKRMAEQLGMALDELDGAAERRLVADLDELAGEPLVAALGVDRASSGELAGRHRAWARALIALHRAWQSRGESVVALADQLNHDPFLGDAVHRMLTRVASIRSAAEILDTVDDLGAEQRRRFVSIIADESGQLSDVTQALAAFFDRGHANTRSVTPVEEVDDFIIEHDNHFADLEQAAMDLRAAAGIAGDCLDELLVGYLRRAQGAEATLNDAPTSALPPSASPESGVLAHTRAASRSPANASPSYAAPATRRFALARQAALAFIGCEALAAKAQASKLLTSDAARRRAERFLASYLAGALLLPYEAFHEAAIALRYDIDALAERFGASYEQVCHRLVTLKRPGASGIPFAFMRTDAAGHLNKRFPLPHLALPRHGHACPLWAIYSALQSPGSTVRQLAAFENADRFLFVARAVEKARPAFALPRRLMSLMIACDVVHADRTVYADGLDLSPAAPATPVGPNCRLCNRRDCVYRQHDPIIDAYSS